MQSLTCSGILSVVPAALLVCAASAQAPEIIHYTFDAGDATNYASGGIGDGIPGAGVGFGPGVLCAGSGNPAVMATATGSTCAIDTGWMPAIAGTDWSVGCHVDWSGQSVGTTTLQYLFGATSSGSNFRCFVGGVAGADDLMLRGPFTELLLPGGGDNAAAVHVVFVCDSAAGEIRGYLNGVLGITVPQPAPTITASANFEVLKYAATSSSVSAGVIVDDFRFYSRALVQAEIDAWVLCGGGGSIGTNYCTAVPNSTGQIGTMSATGSDEAAANNVRLTASDLPNMQFGIFLTSMDQGFVPGGGGTSNGNICLGGLIGRYRQGSQILSTGVTGSFSLPINLMTIPQGSGIAAAMAGDSWNFQAWHRDGGGLGSNFTDGLEIIFQ